VVGEGVGTYCNLKIHQFLRKSTHLIIEAKPKLANIIRRKHKIALSLLLAGHDDAFAWADDRVVDVEGAARLDLQNHYHQYVVPKLDILRIWRQHGELGCELLTAK
jgi:hypothetical protein